MNYLIIKEHYKNGNFEIRQGKQGNIFIVTTNSPIIGVISSENPEKDFHFNISCHSNEEIIGYCKFDFSMMKNETLAMVHFPISATSYITFKILWIKPYKTQLSKTNSINYPKLFTIGHRGLGQNTVTKEYYENSIPSFKAAAERGADFVEFDIQMSKDGVPVIYHDFHIESNEPIHHFPEPVTKSNSGKYLYAVQQLNCNEFKDHGLTTSYQTENVTLEEMLTQLPMSIGFDAEVKYPCYKKLNKTIPYCEVNKFVDTILDVFEKNAGERKVFFSSFDPLIVIALRLKQSRWPVFQLFEKARKESIHDMVKKVHSFVEIHKTIGIEGFVGDSNHLILAPCLIKEIIDNNFVLCSYGDQNDIKNGIDKQIQLGIKGFCTNKVDIVSKIIIHKDKL